jgi:hypothetical protein
MRLNKKISNLVSACFLQTILAHVVWLEPMHAHCFMSFHNIKQFFQLSRLPLLYVAVVSSHFVIQRCRLKYEI